MLAYPELIFASSSNKPQFSFGIHPSLLLQYAWLRSLKPAGYNQTWPCQSWHPLVPAFPTTGTGLRQACNLHLLPSSCMSSSEQEDIIGVPWLLSSKEPASRSGVAGSLPGPGWSPGVGNGSPLQYACLEDYMNRGAWHAIVPGASKSQTRLSRHSVSLPCHWDLAAFLKIGI